MKIKALIGTNASGQSLEAGTVYEVSDRDAQILIGMGRAELYIEDIKPAKKNKTGE